MKQNKTYTPKAADVQREWFVVDATDLPLGRLASEVAKILRGKHKPIFAPHVDVGDHVIVVNAEKVAVTGNKLRDKKYYRYSGHIGSLKTTTLDKLLQEHPERAIEFAVKGMLPKTTLGRQMYRKLHVFAGASHPHAAQQPKPLELA